MIELIFIGDRFYKESQQWMSALYREHPKKTYHLYDYGFLQLDLSAGKEIHIRPPTKDELRFFESKLNENLVKMGYQEGLISRVVNQQDFFDFVLPEIGVPLKNDGD